MNKDLFIEELILQDLRHMQLIYGLEAIGFNEEGFYNLELSASIAELMGAGDDESIDLFNSVYWENIKKCKDLDMVFLGENLRPLAKECYLELKRQLDSDANK